MRLGNTMIDFHSHVLPNIDDGAKDVETSLKMLEESKRQGVTTLLCTPHYYGKRRSPERFLEKRKESYALIADKIPDGLALRFGAEVYFTQDMVASYEDLALLCIEDTRYIMIELPFTSQWSAKLLDRLETFIYETGCTPLIAHIERYPAVLKKPSLAKKLMDMGCLLQVNAEAFEGKATKSFVFALLQKGMVHAVGTDMHNLEDRAPNLRILSAVLSTLPKEVGDALHATESAILDNLPIETKAKSVRKFFGKYF